MAHVRVQYRRSLAGAPPTGTHNVYSGAWFETSTTTPSATVLALLQRLWMGQTSSGISPWFSANPFVSTAGGAQITCWEWDGTHQVKLADYTVSVPAVFLGGTLRSLASQLQVCFGYRSTTGTNVPRGRSRWYYGPLQLPTSMYVDNPLGGLRLSAAGVDVVVNNAKSCLAALAGAGWQLVVASDRAPGVLNFNPALECYVDDVFDVQRPRRTWQTYQKRDAV